MAYSLIWKAFVYVLLTANPVHSWTGLPQARFLFGKRIIFQTCPCLSKQVSPLIWIVYVHSGQTEEARNAKTCKLAAGFSPEPRYRPDSWPTRCPISVGICQYVVYLCWYLSVCCFASSIGWYGSTQHCFLSDLAPTVSSARWFGGLEDNMSQTGSTNFIRFSWCRRSI